METSRMVKKKSKKRVVFKWMLGVFVLLLAAGGGYAYYLYNSVESAVNKMHSPLESDKNKPKPSISGDNRKPLTLLLLGVDERKGDRGRSDTMVVMKLNHEKESMLMFNIPRDTRTEIVGRGYEDKINHAYAFGGTEMAVASAENFIGEPINYCVKVNMESLQKIVDAVGGVTVNNPFAFNYEGYQFNEGTIQLSGKESLAFSRMRKQDPKGDRGRNDRQQQVIAGIINKGAQVSSITKFDNILSILGENVKTNMTFDEMKTIQANYKNARKNVESTEIKGSGSTINGIWYYVVDSSEKQRIHDLLVNF